MKIYRHLKSGISMGLIFALVAPTSALSPASPLPSALSRIGVAGGVHGTVRAFPPASPGEKPVGRIITSGQPLYLNDQIKTGPEGSLQVMLLDETIFTIGPNSSMVLDEFVYDPSNNSGKVTARVTKGTFRFVTGQIGHREPSDMKVKFPVGTMGIRGTIVAGQVSDVGTTAVLLGPGPATNAPGERIGAFKLENAGASVDVVKPGYATHIEGPNGVPSPPALLPPVQLNAIIGAMSGDARQNPGNAGGPQGVKAAAAPSASNQPAPAANNSASNPTAAPAANNSVSNPAAAPATNTSAPSPAAAPAPAPVNTPAPSPDASGQSAMAAPTAASTDNSGSSAAGAPAASADNQSAPAANSAAPSPTGAAAATGSLGSNAGGSTTQQPSASDSAGQTTAGATGDLTSTQQVSNLGTGLSDAELAALNTLNETDLESFIAANTASWDDVRSITTGTGQYAGSNSFTLSQCEGGACADGVGPHGTVEFLMNIDFGAQTIGGNCGGACTASHVAVNANDAALVHGPINESVQFDQASFSTLTGPAVVAGTSASGNLNATVSILNAGGTAASAVAVAQYGDALGTQGKGAVLAPRVDCATGGCK